MSSKKKTKIASHSAGGPATYTGVDYALDCAVSDALPLVVEHLASPIANGSIRMEGRFLSADLPTAWDHIVEATNQRTEAKLSPSRADVREWLQRAAASLQIPGGIRLVYSQLGGPALGQIRILRDLAVETATDEQWFAGVRLLRNQGFQEWLAYGGERPRELFRRLEFRHVAHEELTQALSERVTVMAGTAGANVLNALRRNLLEAAKRRAAVSAAEMLSCMRRTGACLIAPPTAPVSASDIRGKVFQIVANAGHVPVPRILLTQEMPWSESNATEAIDTLCEHGLLAKRGDAVVLIFEKSPPPPPNLPEILLPALRRCVALLRNNAPGSEQRDLTRLGVELLERIALQQPEEVAAAFAFLDKPLKNLGDIFSVRRMGFLCVGAAERCQSASEAVRKGHAQALICAVSWAEQRMGDLISARMHAEQSLALGEAIGWARNTAFCRKCLGRLLRMLGQQEIDPKTRTRLFEESVDQLQQAMGLFNRLDELNEEAREREVAACQSLLARTMMEGGKLAQAKRLVTLASKTLANGNDKDSVDLLILQGELADRDGSDPAEALFFLTNAIEKSSASWTFEVNEMRARALRARGRLRERSTENRIADLEEAGRLFEVLGDERHNAAALLDVYRLRGQIPKTFDSRLTREPEYVALGALQQYLRATARSKASAVARRSSYTVKDYERYISEARANVAYDRPTLLTARPDSIRLASEPRRRRTSSRAKIALDKLLAQLTPGPGRRVGAIRRLADALLLDIMTLPVPLRTIGERLGVEEFNLEESCGAGHLEGENGSWRVVASQADPSGRQRFTIAHELAHAQLLSVPGLAPQAGRELEQFCDRLASELLMPAAPFRALFPGGIVTLDAIGIAVRTFDVSFSAAALRGQEIFPKTIVFLVGDGVVVWGSGGIQRGTLLGLPPEVGRIVRMSLDGSVHEDRVYAQLELHEGMWNISSQKLGVGARLFVMTPIPRPRPSLRPVR